MGLLLLGVMGLIAGRSGDNRFYLRWGTVERVSLVGAVAGEVESVTGDFEMLGRIRTSSPWVTSASPDNGWIACGRWVV